MDRQGEHFTDLEKKFFERGQDPVATHMKAAEKQARDADKERKEKLWKEAKEIRRPGMIEVHIAASKVENSKLTALFESLDKIGIKKHKFFVDIKNCEGNPLTGHDLKGPGPGSMSTTYVRTMEEAQSLVRAGMQTLKDHGIEGNFEIELVLAPDVKDYDKQAVDKIQQEDMPEYVEPKDSPQYENHVVWSGIRSELPDFNQIEKMMRAQGVAPHQIVEFSDKPDPGKNDRVTRVGTIYYQPQQNTGKDAVVDVSTFLKGAELQKDWGYEYTLAEQVIFVGEPR